MKANSAKAPAAPPAFSFPVLRREVMECFAKQAVPPSKLTNVVAPAGYGKTIFLTALFQHYRECGQNVFWLSLDEKNTSPDAFLAQMEKTVLQERAAEGLEHALQGDGRPLRHRLDDVLERLSLLAEPTILVIDNISFVSGQELAGFVEALVHQTPSHFYLVLAGTRDLDLDLTRLEMAGLLTRIGYEQLAFKLPQIQQAFGDELSALLGAANMHRIVKRTEGWPAAVRLMQILLSNSDNPAAAVSEFSGSDKDLGDMLNRGALAQFPPSVRQFLFELAPLRQFNLALCRECTGDPQASEHLEYLLENHFFIVPVDRNRKWYRLHGLLRQFLLAEAEETISASRRKEVLSRAARWCEDHDRWADAVDYALLAGDGKRATAVIDRVPARFVRDAGDIKSFTHWVEVLERSAVQLSWDARYWYVWALVFCHRYEQVPQKARPLREEVLGGHAEGDLSSIDRERLHRLDLIRISADIYLDNLQPALADGSKWLQAAENADPFDKATMGCACSICCVGNYEFAQARAYLAQAEASIAQADSQYGAGWVGTLKLLPTLVEGDYELAYCRLKAQLQTTRYALGDRAGMTSTVALVASKAAVETGREAEAREWLERAFPMVASHGLLDTAAFGIDAAIKLWESPHAISLTLDEMQELVAGYPPRLRVMFSCWLIRRLLRLGRLDEALVEAGKLGASDGQLGEPDMRFPLLAQSLWSMTQIDLDIAAGRLRHADSRIHEELATARSSGRYGHLVELLLSQMNMALSAQNEELAARKLATAVRHAAKRRFIRPFVDCGDRVAAIVNDTKPGSWGFVLAEEQDFFAEICRRLPPEANRIRDRLEELDVDASLLEQPTPRELEMLALIEIGLSNKQLAERLDLTVPTVKWHLYNLYQKLGVSSRAAAIAKAKALNLLTV